MGDRSSLGGSPSDGGLVVFAFRRCILLNGIDLGALRDDLAERLLTLRLARIGSRARRYEADLDEAWARAHPRILGAVLDLTAACIAAFPSVHLESKPRMADFGRVLAAVDHVLGTDGMTRYAGQGVELTADVLDSDPVLAAIAARITTPYEGTSAELLTLLTPTHDEDDRWRPPRGWPKDARTLTGILRRRAPSLRKLGWKVDDLGRYGHVPAIHFGLTPPQDDTSGTDERKAGDDACDAVSLAPAPSQASDASDANAVTSPPLAAVDNDEGDDLDRAERLVTEAFGAAVAGRHDYRTPAMVEQDRLRDLAFGGRTYR